MKKRRFLFVCMFALFSLFTFSCSEDKAQEQIFLSLAEGISSEQVVFADDTELKTDINFVAPAPWIAEVEYIALQVDLLEVKAENEQNGWIELDKYSGEAGVQAIEVTLSENETGDDRSAIILIKSGDAQIVIKIEQKGYKSSDIPGEGEGGETPGEGEGGETPGDGEGGETPGEGEGGETPGGGSGEITPPIDDPNVEDIFSTIDFDEMVLVPAGSYIMGADSDDAKDDEYPIHRVYVSSFYMGKYEVTQALYKYVMDGDNPSLQKGDNLPVNNVGWFDCFLFIERLNSLTGKKFRLPTEAEWEYAARGAKNSAGTLENMELYGIPSGQRIYEVGSKSPNALGLYDMNGNVWEWCSDYYGPYSSSTQNNPQGPETGYFKVMRGGAWYDSESDCTVSERKSVAPPKKDESQGFRLVMEY